MKKQQKMRKTIQILMAFMAILLGVACSSEQQDMVESGTGLQKMTFTAMQEGSGAASRTAINTENSKEIIWENGDKLRLFTPNDVLQTYSYNVTLASGAGTTVATFTGWASSAPSYTAVYPAAAGEGPNVKLVSPGVIANVSFSPQVQDATAGSFDKTDALMMAYSTNTGLAFKNVVGFIKVTPQFDCKQIVLKAFDNSTALGWTPTGSMSSGDTGYTLDYNNGAPTLTLDNDVANNKDYDYAITLKGPITADKTYYIVVPPVTLKAGWSLAFTDNDGTVYQRKGTKELAIKRNTVTDLGTFTNETSWYNARGKVTEKDEVDLGLTLTIGSVKYKVLFAKRNLTASGLAANETDLGDYFAWGATEPWCTSYTRTVTDGFSSLTVKQWKDGYKDFGYSDSKAPYHDGSKYRSEDTTLEAMDDAANKILGGDWQMPSAEIWRMMFNASNGSTTTWKDNLNCSFTTIDNVKGLKVAKKDDDNTYIFLPIGGHFNCDTYYDNTAGYYWSGSAYSPDANNHVQGQYLFFQYDNDYSIRPSKYLNYLGFLIRPIRLVPVVANND